MNRMYFFYLNGKNVGPFERSELIGIEFASDTLVWYSGLENWVKVIEVEELKEIIKIAPPPVPFESPNVSVGGKNNWSGNFAKEIVLNAKLFMLSMIAAILTLIIVSIVFIPKILIYKKAIKVCEYVSEFNDSDIEGIKKNVYKLFLTNPELVDEREVYLYFFERPKDLSDLALETFNNAYTNLPLYYKENYDLECFLPKKFSQVTGILEKSGIRKIDLSVFSPVFKDETYNTIYVDAYDPIAPKGKVALANLSIYYDSMIEYYIEKLKYWGLNTVLYLTVVLIFGRYIVLGLKWIKRKSKE